MNVVFNRDTYELPLLLFEKLGVERGFVTWRHSKWRTAEQHLDGLSNVSYRYAGDDGRRTVRLEREVAAALVELDRHGQVDLLIAAANEAGLIGLLDEVRVALSPVAAIESHEAAVRFWTVGVPRPDSVVRNVAVPTWPEIRVNYAPTVVETLDRLMARREPPTGGQLMLWHGPPGTGKTHAIRALVREWRDWVHAEYVVDPEAFFGGAASYIMSVLLGDDDSLHDDPEKWRLLIFEDTGELLSADAKERVGQGLSRLLNTVDGLLGQGLRVLILMTTNDELGSLHPAVRRPGRCSVNLRFGPFDRTAAAAWLATHDVALPDSMSAPTLADLFGLVGGHENLGAQPQPIGFGAPR